MMKGKRENKSCSHSPKEKENLGKVEPGLDFREQEFNYSLCHCVFLIRATVGAGTSQHSAGKGHKSTRNRSPVWTHTHTVSSPIWCSLSAPMVKEKEKEGCLFRTEGHQSDHCCGSLLLLSRFDKSQHLRASQRMKTHMELILLMIYSARRRLLSSLCEKHIWSPWVKNYTSVFSAKHIFKFLLIRGSHGFGN